MQLSSTEIPQVDRGQSWTPNSVWLNQEVAITPAETESFAVSRSDRSQSPTEREGFQMEQGATWKDGSKAGEPGE